MKLSDLKPCALCGGPLRKDGLIQWYVIRIGRAFLNPDAFNRTMGLAQMLGGSLALAEVMGPDADRAVVVLEDEPGLHLTELHVCTECYHSPERLIADLAGAAELKEREN